jgi:hypothetical protein
VLLAMVLLLSSTRKRVVGQLIATPTLRPSLSHISNTPKQIFLRASRPRALSRSMCALDSAFQCVSVPKPMLGRPADTYGISSKAARLT